MKKLIKLEIIIDGNQSSQDQIGAFCAALQRLLQVQESVKFNDITKPQAVISVRLDTTQGKNFVHRNNQN